MAQARRGHFRLESGYHSTLWLDLDALFADPQAIAPFVGALAAQLREHAIEIVCGPLLGGAFLAPLLAQSLAAEFCFTERSAVKADGLFGTRYELPSAHRARVRWRRVALVDDVISAGSALRGTYAALQAAGAIPVATGAPRTMKRPDDLLAQQEAHPRARRFFEQLDNRTRYAILYRRQDAKKADTRLRRLEKFVRMLEAGETLH